MERQWRRGEGSGGERRRRVGAAVEGRGGQTRGEEEKGGEEKDKMNSSPQSIPLPPSYQSKNIFGLGKRAESHVNPVHPMVCPAWSFFPAAASL